MELKWLEDFLAVAGSGNFSRAAETRNVTQPAFSRRLKALETWLGASLLDRGSHPIALTPAGAKFLPVAEQLVRELRSARDEARAASTGAGSMLKLAMPHSLAVDFFPVWWPSVSKGLDRLATKVIADNLHDCVELLLQGGCDFLLCYRFDKVPNPVISADFHGVVIATDSLVAVCAADATGRACHRLDAGNGAAVPFLNYAPDAFLGKVTASLLGTLASPLPLRLTYESAFAEAVRAQTRAGAGVSWLPRRLIAADLDLGSLVPAGDGLPEATLEIWLYRAARKSTKDVEAIWQAACLLTGGARG